MTQPHHLGALLGMALLAACASTEPRSNVHVVEGVMGMDPRAEQALTRMCDALKAADRLSFRAEVLVDDVQPRGQKIQYEGVVDIALQRDTGLRADLRGDVDAESIFYDGRVLTIADAEDRVYASTPAPPTIDSTLDDAASRYGIVIPFADLLYSDPQAVLTENIVSGSYLGIHGVRGVPCHHVAFSTPDLAWQAWIDQGEPAVPKKIVITYVHEVASPQYVGVFTSWDLAPTWAEGQFTYPPPEGAEKIELLEVVRR